MNEEQILKLADKSCLSYFPGWVSSGPGLQHLTAFANACEQVGRDAANLELAAQLKALSEQEPVGEKSENGIEWQYANTVHDMPMRTKLYTQAKPAVQEGK